MSCLSDPFLLNIFCFALHDLLLDASSMHVLQSKTNLKVHLHTEVHKQGSHRQQGRISKVVEIYCTFLCAFLGCVFGKYQGDKDVSVCASISVSCVWFFQCDLVNDNMGKTKRQKEMNIKQEGTVRVCYTWKTGKLNIDWRITLGKNRLLSPWNKCKNYKQIRVLKKDIIKNPQVCFCFLFFSITTKYIRKVGREYIPYCIPSDWLLFGCKLLWRRQIVV